MTYQEYIDLGFNRTDMHDIVEFERTGYYGFALERKLYGGMLVCVTSDDLDNPKLYIKKRYSDTYHITAIPTEAVRDLFKKEESILEAC
jgi:hypothetical protein